MLKIPEIMDSKYILIFAREYKIRYLLENTKYDIC